MPSFEFIGYLAAALTTCGFVPQVRHTPALAILAMKLRYR